VPRSHVAGSTAVDVPDVLRIARNVAVFAVGYAASSRFADAALSTSELPPAVFVPGALVLTALLLTPPARWWTVLSATLLGHWFATLGEGASLGAVLGSFTINTACALLTATLVRRYVELQWGLAALRSIGPFTIISLSAPLIALLGSAVLFRIDAPLDPTNPDGLATSAMAWIPWLIAALGTTLAYLTIVPVGLASHAALTSTFAGESPVVVRWPRAAEAVMLAAAVTLVTAAAFAPLPRYPIAQVILLFAPIPLVLYAALRFGLAGVAVALLITACGVARGALHGALPFPASPPGTGIIVYQLVFLTIAAPFLVLAAALDERRRASAQTTAAEARYALATVAGHAFVYSYHPASGAVVADSALGALLGLAPAELQSPAWWWRQVHPDDAATLQRTWSARLRATQAGGADSPTDDFRLLDREGRIRWFRDHPAPFQPPDADAATVVGTITDVTALKAAEQLAEQRSRELAHVARTAVVGELAAALAHEIRQPLTAILINAQTAVRVLDAQPRDPEAVREILQQLAADGRRAGEVVQRVRAFAKKGDVERGPIDLNALLRETVQLVRHDTIRRHTEIRFALTHDSIVVFGDRVQLQQVFLNLVLNALEALTDLPPGAERLVLIESARAATHTAIVTVRDTGPGIARERQPAIFEPFITTKPNGLGVGLSIGRTIVEAHGGIIWCESDPAVGGSAFVVAIPLGSTRRA
jgi:PAS domain S-box-containing protein